MKPALRRLLVSAIILAFLPAALSAAALTPGRSPGAAPHTPRVYDDVPMAPIAIDQLAGCDGGEIVRSFKVAEDFTVVDVRLGLNAAHAYRGDLRAWLESPAGTKVEVIRSTTKNTSANYDLLLSDDAVNPIDDHDPDDTSAPYFDRLARPAHPFEAFDGQKSEGAWVLTLCDNETSMDEGAYNRSRLVLEPAPASPLLRATIATDRLKTTSGMTVPYTVTVRNAGQDTASGVTLNNPLPAGLDFVAGSLQTEGTPPAVYAGGEVTWSGAVGPGGRITVTYQAAVIGASGIITNTAKVGNQDPPLAVEASVASQIFPSRDRLYTNERDYPIPDDECITALASPVHVADGFRVAAVRVGIGLYHPYRGDVYAVLESPAGVRAVLIAADSASDSENIDILLDDAASEPFDDGDDDDLAAPFYDRLVAPAQPLSRFAGQEAAGTWTLHVCDTSRLDYGALQQWSLFLRPAVASTVYMPLLLR